MLKETTEEDEIDWGFVDDIPDNLQTEGQMVYDP